MFCRVTPGSSTKLLCPICSIFSFWSAQFLFVWQFTNVAIQAHCLYILRVHKKIHYWRLISTGAKHYTAGTELDLCLKTMIKMEKLSYRALNQAKLYCQRAGRFYTSYWCRCIWVIHEIKRKILSVLLCVHFTLNCIQRNLFTTQYAVHCIMCIYTIHSSVHWI